MQAGGKQRNSLWPEPKPMEVTHDSRLTITTPTRTSIPGVVVKTSTSRARDEPAEFIANLPRHRYCPMPPYAEPTAKRGGSDSRPLEHVDRRVFIGGSDARIIMGSDEAALVRLWREKRGEAEPEDLSGNLIVQLGTATEALNRAWYERNTGRAITDVQRRVKHSAIPWMAATLDGIVEGTGAVFESKFMLPWSFSEEAAAEKYMAQLQHNMWVTHCRTRGAVDHHRWRQMGGDHDSHGPALSDRSGGGGEEVLALRPIG